MEEPKFELERLLKAKRFEMPDEAFWDAFDARLKSSLAAEVQPRRVSWRQYLGAWLRRWSPVAAVGLFVFGGICHFSFRFNAPHLEVCFQPSDVQSCRSLAFHVAPSSEVVKSVLKKNVALTDGDRFTF